VLAACGLALLLLSCAAAPAFRAEREDLAAAPAQSPVVMHDPRLPAGAVRSFLAACRRGNYEKAARLLDLRGAALEPAPDAAHLAWQLKAVLDRELRIPLERLSADPAGDLDDGLPRDLERIGRIDDTDILLQRIEDETGQQVWKLAAPTVARIPELYAAHGYGALAEILPRPMFDIRFLDIQLWQWIGLLLLAPLAYAASRVAVVLVYPALRAVARRTEATWDDQLLDEMRGPARALAALALFAAGTLGLALAVRVYDWLGRLEQALLIAVLAWLTMRGVDVLARAAEARLRGADRQAAMAVLPLGRRVAKAFLVLVALIALLQNVGFNVTGLIAGLGVGGLAVALAAQKSIANLFGGVSLVTDRPVRVGDFCRFGDGKSGTVEEIGLRSTRVRTLDRTIVSIPNAEFSEVQIENYATRDRIRLFAILNLRYETTPDQLRFILAELRRLLASHPRVTPEPARARFVAFGGYSLDVEVFAYVDTSDWDEFLKVREDIYLRIMDVVRESGTGFAFPSQTLYLARDRPPDAERTRAAEQQVVEWRDRGRLPFPDFAASTLAEWDDTVDYPPRGSATGTDPGVRERPREID
jgi:MscS family membrane protein